MGRAEFTVDDMPSAGGLKAHWPWSIACAFGTIEFGSEEDPGRYIWNGARGAVDMADAVNGFGFGRHCFAVPLPCPGDRP